MKDQCIPDDVAAVLPTTDNITHFRDREPEMLAMIEDIAGAMRQDMIPSDLQELLFEAMNPSVRRQMVAKRSGLDANILTTFKDQLTLVDAVLRRTFNEDGTLKSVDENSLVMSPKDILNLSLKISQMMVKELPKVYSIERIQRMEQAFIEVAEGYMTREQQEAFIDAVEKRQAKL